jgi:hypothetical protein
MMMVGVFFKLPNSDIVLETDEGAAALNNAIKSRTID